jgi:hypothetical protein
VKLTQLSGASTMPYRYAAPSLAIVIAWPASAVVTAVVSPWHGPSVHRTFIRTSGDRCGPEGLSERDRRPNGAGLRSLALMATLVGHDCPQSGQILCFCIECRHCGAVLAEHAPVEAIHAEIHVLISEHNCPRSEAPTALA